MSRLAPLRSLADYLRDGAPLPERDRERLAEGLGRFLAGDAGLEEALGLKPEAGQRSALTQASLDERDRLLREAAAEFFPDLSPAAQARELARSLTRYRASGWQHERTLDAPAPYRAGTLNERLWAVLRARDYALGEDRLRKILSGS